MSRITNRRWALSAFGTASSAALTPADTVYSVTPLLPPLGADDEHRRRDRGRRAAGDGHAASIRRRSGRRCAATASPSRRTPGRCCTTSSRRRRSPASATIRCGCSSARACRAGLWRRVEQRFAPGAGARVLRLDRGRARSSSTCADVKPGAMGRPLPGSAEVRIAQYDLDAGGLVLGRDGFAQRCGVDEVGMLLARVSPSEPLSVDAAARACSRRRLPGSSPAICSGATPTATTGASTASATSSDSAHGPGVHDADPRRAGGRSGGRSRGRLRRRCRRAASTRSRWPRSRCAPGRS